MTEVRSHWWVTHRATLPDVLRSARVAIDNGSGPQMIHFHAHDDACDPPGEDRCYVYLGVVSDSTLNSRNDVLG